MSERDDMRAQILSLVDENERLRRGIAQTNLFFRLPLPAEVESALVAWCEARGVRCAGALSGRGVAAAATVCASASALLSAADAVATALRDIAGESHESYLDEYEAASSVVRALIRELES